MDHATPENPSWLARIWTALGAAWGAVSTRLFTWWHAGNRDAAKALLLIVLVGVLLLGFLLHTPGPAPVPAPAPAPAVETPPGLQDQIDALRLRVIVLEVRADAAPKPAAAPRASAPRTSAARTGAENPAAPTEPQPAAAPPKRWGTTDLDREIAAFPSTPSLEQAK